MSRRKKRSGKKVTRRRNCVLPYDCWCLIIEFLSHFKTFKNLTLSVSGLFDYVKKFDNSASKNVIFSLKKLPRNRKPKHQYVRKIKIFGCYYPNMNRIFDVFDQARSINLLNPKKKVMKFGANRPHQHFQELKISNMYDFDFDIRNYDLPNLKMLTLNYIQPKHYYYNNYDGGFVKFVDMDIFHSIHHLVLNRYTFSFRTTKTNMLQRLRSLRVVDTRSPVTKICGFSSLETLSLVKVRNIEAISNLPKLRRLEIHSVDTYKSCSIDDDLQIPLTSSHDVKPVDVHWNSISSKLEVMHLTDFHLNKNTNVQNFLDGFMENVYVAKIDLKSINEESEDIVTISSLKLRELFISIPSVEFCLRKNNNLRRLCISKWKDNNNNNNNTSKDDQDSQQEGKIELSKLDTFKLDNSYHFPFDCEWIYGLKRLIISDCKRFIFKKKNRIFDGKKFMNLEILEIRSSFNFIENNFMIKKFRNMDSTNLGVFRICFKNFDMIVEDFSGLPENVTVIYEHRIETVDKMTKEYYQYHVMMGMVDPFKKKFVKKETDREFLIERSEKFKKMLRKMAEKEKKEKVKKKKEERKRNRKRKKRKRKKR